MACRHLPALAFLVIFGLACSAKAPALALEGSLGPAVRWEPAYPGAASYTARLRPTGRVAMADRLHVDLRTPATASLDVVEPGQWRLAVLGQYLPGRSNALLSAHNRLATRAPGLGLGAVAERTGGPLSLRLGMYRDVTRRDGGVGGWVGAEAQTRLGLTSWVAGIEGLIEAGNAAHLAQRVGVDESEADGAGDLSAYRPTGGLSRATVRLTGVYLANRNWAVAGRAAVARLGPALAASPLAETTWQGRLSAALLYRF